MNLRFDLVVASSLFYVIYAVPKANYMIKHPEKYSEQERFEFGCKIMNFMRKRSRTKTYVSGMENLPEDENYILYANHQGKYDVLGILITHEEPCSFVMDKNKSHTMLVREFIDLVQGKRLEKDNPRQGIVIINEVTKEVAAGRKYILFPEGGYKFNNRNKVCDFKAGSFKIALKSKAPIIPIALIDSYKVFNSFHLGPITTQVHYLEPITYDEYKDMKTHEIAALVKKRIEEKIASIEKN